MLNGKEKIQQIVMQKENNSMLMNINPIDEWIKWLEYDPEPQKERINNLEQKGHANLSIDEFQYLFEYYQEKIILNLFKKYKENDVREEDCAHIYKYMQKNILNVCNKKLSIEEKEEALNKISKYEAMETNELKNIIHNKFYKKEYNSLSMVDSYVLHVICNTANTRQFEEFENNTNKVKKYCKYKQED